MKVGVALVVEREAPKVMRKMRGDIERTIGCDYKGTLLAPHILLRQVRPVSCVTKVQEYFENLAGEIRPWKVKIIASSVQKLQADIGTYAVTWIDVKETGVLRSWREIINKEFADKFGDEGYDSRHSERGVLGERWQIGGAVTGLRVRTSGIGMFFYDDDGVRLMSYNVLQLKGQR